MDALCPLLIAALLLAPAPAFAAPLTLRIPALQLATAEPAPPTLEPLPAAPSVAATPDQSDRNSALETATLLSVGALSLGVFDLERHAICPSDASSFDCGFQLFIFSTAAAALVGPLATWGLHVGLGGSGTYAAAFKGYLLGVVGWPLVWAFTAWLISGVDVTVPIFALATQAGLLGFAIPGILTGALAGAALLEADSRSGMNAVSVVPWVGPNLGGVRLAAAF